MSTRFGSRIGVDSKTSGAAVSVILLEAGGPVGTSQRSAHDSVRNVFRGPLGGSSGHNRSGHLLVVAAELIDRGCNVPYVRTIHDSVSPDHPRLGGIRNADAAADRVVTISIAID